MGDCNIDELRAGGICFFWGLMPAVLDNSINEGQDNVLTDALIWSASKYCCDSISANVCLYTSVKCMATLLNMTQSIHWLLSESSNKFLTLKSKFLFPALENKYFSTKNFHMKMFNGEFFLDYSISNETKQWSLWRSMWQCYWWGLSLILLSSIDDRTSSVPHIMMSSKINSICMSFYY